MHRDIKEANFTLCKDGYLKAAYTSTFTLVEEKQYSLVSTSRYLAPEVLKFEGYDFASDFW